MAEHETVTDIIAEMRALSNPISDGIIAIDGRSIADRLEAAHKREKQNALDAGGFVEASRKNKPVGNAAKLREADKAHAMMRAINKSLVALTTTEK